MYFSLYQTDYKETIYILTVNLVMEFARIWVLFLWFLPPNLWLG